MYCRIFTHAWVRISEPINEPPISQFGVFIPQTYDIELQALTDISIFRSQVGFIQSFSFVSRNNIFPGQDKTHAVAIIVIPPPVLLSVVGKWVCN